jgi:hypothetical protein
MGLIFIQGVRRHIYKMYLKLKYCRTGSSVSKTVYIYIIKINKEGTLFRSSFHLSRELSFILVQSIVAVAVSFGISRFCFPSTRPHHLNRMDFVSFTESFPCNVPFISLPAHIVTSFSLFTSSRYFLVISRSSLPRFIAPDTKRK